MDREIREAVRNGDYTHLVFLLSKIETTPQNQLIPGDHVIVVQDPNYSWIQGSHYTGRVRPYKEDEQLSVELDPEYLWTDESRNPKSKRKLTSIQSFKPIQTYKRAKPRIIYLNDFDKVYEGILTPNVTRNTVETATDFGSLGRNLEF